MKKYNIALVLFMNDKAIALKCPRYCDIEIMQDLMSWNKNEAKIVWKELEYLIFVESCMGLFSENWPYCIFEDEIRKSDEDDCSKCFFGKKNKICSEDDSLFSKLTISKNRRGLSNEFYKNSIENIQEILEMEQ